MLSGTKLPVDNKVSLHVSVEYRDEICFMKKKCVFVCAHKNKNFLNFTRTKLFGIIMRFLGNCPPTPSLICMYSCFPLFSSINIDSTNHVATNWYSLTKNKVFQAFRQ